VLVAGATGAIGGDIANGLRQAGATVALHGRRAREGAFAADLAQPGAAQALIAEVTARHGAPLMLVNLVHAPFVPRAVKDADWETDWLPHFTHGFLPALALTQAMLPAMIAAGFGRIVHVSGGLSTRPARGYAGYSCTKAALNMLARCTALEHGADGVTVNVVAPGEVRTAAPTDPAHAGVNAAQQAVQAIPGVATPADVAAAIIGFLDPAARFVTGQVVFVNGGQVMP
jgi:3-oxoacyl-[acyl-carrier protein] reductase